MTRPRLPLTSPTLPTPTPTPTQTPSTQIDIHPAARIGEGVFIDHGTGIVIGETAVVGHNVSMLHMVTLGGSGRKHVDRHPKIGAFFLS